MSSINNAGFINPGAGRIVTKFGKDVASKMASGTNAVDALKETAKEMVYEKIETATGIDVQEISSTISDIKDAMADSSEGGEPVG